jgi:DNA repair exonuclease SbcCD nuclease subunit
MSRIIAIGDPHFQISNIPEVKSFVQKCIEYCTLIEPDIIVVLGDLLHTHERLHSLVLNEAHEFIKQLSKISSTYVIVGNHDMCNNSQFLTTNHWMNAMKEWENVNIIDTVQSLKTKHNETFIFVPYVSPGRFIEALETKFNENEWKESTAIFSHQEFCGCKMGAIVSVDGDIGCCG